MSDIDTELKEAWDRVKDSKDSVSHELVMGKPPECMTWAYQMRRDLNAFIEILDHKCRADANPGIPMPAPPPAP